MVLDEQVRLLVISDTASKNVIDYMVRHHCYPNSGPTRMLPWHFRGQHYRGVQCKLELDIAVLTAMRMAA